MKESINSLFRNRVNLILVLFFCVYGLISFVNHYFFRTACLDLGLYTNALFDYSHFQFNDSLAFKSIPENLLSDHFDLYLMMFSPFSLLFGSYTLLIVQIVAVLIGAKGIYSYFNIDDYQKKWALSAMLFFLTFFGIYSALSFDYHSNVVAACLLPWFFVFVKKKKLIPAFLLLLLVVVAKENISLWVGFVCFGLVFEYLKDRKMRLFLILLGLFCFIYFVAITMAVMPMLSSSKEYAHFQYEVLGNNFKDAILHLIAHPIDSIKTMFINHNKSQFGNYVKLELFGVLIGAGFLILFRRPYFIIMLLPIFFQKLFHNNPNMWGVLMQYSIEFAPILAIGIFTIISKGAKERLNKIASYLIIISSLVTTIYVINKKGPFNNNTEICFYSKEHYHKNYNVNDVYEAMKLIPASAKVSAQSCYLPHLALRDFIYQFPRIDDADYLIYSMNENPYPFDHDEFPIFIQKLENSSDWKVIYKNSHLRILKKKGI